MREHRMLGHRLPGHLMRGHLMRDTWCGHTWWGDTWCEDICGGDTEASSRQRTISSNSSRTIPGGAGPSFPRYSWPLLVLLDNCPPPWSGHPYCVRELGWHPLGARLARVRAPSNFNVHINRTIHQISFTSGRQLYLFLEQHPAFSFLRCKGYAFPAHVAHPSEDPLLFLVPPTSKFPEAILPHGRMPHH